MSVVAELCIAGLTFVQRRQDVGARRGTETFLKTFMALSQPGMQPYSTTFLGIFGCGRAAKRNFEQFAPQVDVTDTCPSFLGLTPQDIVIIATPIFAFACGPLVQ